MNRYLLTLIFTMFVILQSAEAQSLERSQFMKEVRAFAQQKQIDNNRIGSPDYLETEFAFIEEFGILQFTRRRPSIEGMDRDPRWAPFKENKVSLNDGTEMSASYLHFAAEHPYHNFIASQAPYAHNTHLFWQMVWEKQVNQIVMVTELAEPKGELSASYWPDKPNQTQKLKNGLTVTLVNERWLLHKLNENIQIRTFVVSRGGKKRAVTHYWYHNWPDQTAPSQFDTITTLIKTVRQEKGRSRSKAPILVHCHGGVGRTGVFVTLYHLFQRKELGDKRISLFECVAHLRWQRTKMVSKPSQYEFCYGVTRAYGL